MLSLVHKITIYCLLTKIKNMPYLLFLTPFVTTIIFIVILLPWAKKIGLMDKPNHRKLHQKPIPLIGGIAIFMGIVITVLTSGNKLSHPNEFILAVGILAVTGLIDDRNDLNVRYRIIAQIIATLIMAMFADIKITELGNIFGTGNIKLGGFSTAFTIFAVLGGINAFNMIDGIDGLAGSIALISITSIALITGLSGYMPIYCLSIILIATIIAFLLFNLRIFGRKSASIFLGDTGSTLLGFTVCWLCISVTQGENKIIPPVTVLWLTAIPFFDAISVMYRRIRSNRSPWLADREHLHHFLAELGYKVNHKLIILVSCAILFSTISLASTFLFEISEMMLFFVFLILFSIYYKCINKAWKSINLNKNFPKDETSKEKINA